MSLQNTLSAELSPYLLQHALNPVAWQAWNAAALAAARQADRPILLSIGYSACHWCHVMAHESFEHTETAELMNRLFVNIKVDREERPDLDKVYQLAHQIIARRTGGWPLTVFLDPHSLAPFFAGTYFPIEARYGMPPFRQVLSQVAAYYRTHPQDIARQKVELIALLQGQDSLSPELKLESADRLDAAPLDMARHQMAHHFDAGQGGFGAAPKFPHPGHIDRLLRYWSSSVQSGHEDQQALHMACFSLEKMAEGGLYDQLGGGFFRYSVDDHWEIPHFEKMLYDNAQLLALYAQAWAASGHPLFKRVARETAAWMIEEMQGDDGGFYSTIDADSEGGEGRYYVWGREEIAALLGEDAGPFAASFGLDQLANFEGRWHLRIRSDTTGQNGTVAASQAHVNVGTSTDVAALFTTARQQLLTQRQGRAAPACDDKVLTAWNALAIRGLALAARHTQDAACLTAALRALDHVVQLLWRDDRLLATQRHGEARLAAYLDDYVFLIDAIIELIQLRWDNGLLAFACRLADSVIEHFYDTGRGGFYFTADDHESLIYRPRPFADDAMPAGNGVAARALARLGHLVHHSPYLDASTGTLQAAWQELGEMPYAHDSLLSALEEHLMPPQIIILRGQGDALAQWQALALQSYAPRRMVFAISAEMDSLHPALQPYRPQSLSQGESCCAYLCEGMRCREPILTFDGFRSALQRNRDQN